MSDPSSTPPTPPPDHDYIRPGQLVPGHNAPDQCMICGRSLAEHRAASYMQQAGQQDAYLAERLIAISGQYDAGDITELEACYLRVASLEHHIETSRNLRAEFFGGTP